MTARHPNGFRFSDEFIKRWEKNLTIALFAVTGTGIALGLATEIEGAPTWLGEVALVVVVAGVVGPLLAGGLLGGEAIRPGGGVVGVLVVAGLVGGASGQAFEIPWLMWTGGVALALGVVAFWTMGWIAKVPMYLGLRGAHGRVVQREDGHQDLIGGDDPRLRVRRPKRPRG